MKKNLPLFVVVIVMLVVVGIGVISAQGSSPFGAGGAGDGAVFEAGDSIATSPELSKAEQAAALAYWTPEREAALSPISMVDFSATGAVDRAGLRDAKEVGGQAVSYAAGAANLNAERIAQEAYAADWSAAEGASAAAPVAVDGTSQIFTGYVVKESHFSKWYPHKWVGRFQSNKGYCSGTAISNNHVLTAAHCVWDNNDDTWNSSMTFKPAYRDGATPYGTFPVFSCSIFVAFQNLPAAYSITTWAPIDMAVCDSGLNSASRTLNYMVGWAGREMDAGSTRHVHNMGFPWNDYNNNAYWTAGRYLWACIGETAYYSSDVRRVGCNTGGGMSGGPWMTRYGAVDPATGYVTGVNSGIIYTQQNLYAGRFTSSNIGVLCTAEGC